MFDPYRDWLGMTDDRRPPTLYQLLGIAPAESDPKAIEAAVTRQLAKVQNHLTGSKSKTAWQVVDEITLAKTTLLDPTKRSAYDMVFGTGPKKAPPSAGPIGHSSQSAPLAPPIPTAPPMSPAWSTTPAPLASELPSLPPRQPTGEAFVAAPRFNLLDENESPSDDGLPSVTTLTKPRVPRGNSNLLLLGGGVVVLAVVGVIIALAMRGGKSLPELTEKKPEAPDDSTVHKQPPPPTKKELPKEKDRGKKITPPPKAEETPPKKKETPPKNDPPPKKVEPGAEFKEARVFSGHEKTARALAVSADGKQFLSVGDDKAVNLWSPASDKPSRCFTAQSEGVGAAFLPGGREAIVADGGQCYLIDLAANSQKKEFKTPAGGVVAIAVCSDGQHFLSVLQIGQLHWWDVNKEAPERTIELGINAPINCLAMTNDGKTALVGNRADGMVSVWNVSTGKLIKRWKAHSPDVIAAAFSPDGKRVATVGQDNLVKVWDPFTGSELLTLKGHTDAPLAVAYSADGALLFTTGIDQSVRAWDAVTGAALPWSFQAGEKIFSLAVDPKDRFLIVGLSGGAVQMFFVPAVRPDSVPRKDWVQPPPTPLPPPSAGEIESAVKSIRERYKNDYALAALQDQQALAGKLLNRAKTAPEDSSARFALFQEARDLYAKIGQMADAFKAIEARAVWFRADDLEEKATALKAAGMKTPGKDVAEAAVALLEEAEKRMRPDIVNELLLQFPSLPDMPELSARIEAAKKRWETSAAERETSGKLATELKKDPDSPAANLQYGKYLCFRVGEWEDGLPKLIKGDDAALKELANKEIAAPKDTKGQLELAKGWFDHAPKADDLLKPAILIRSKYWYERAIANNLPATDRLPVNQKLTDIAKQLAALGNVTLARPGEAVNRREFNTLRSKISFESQWLSVGSAGVTPAGVLLGANASLTSRFKVLDGGRVVFSFVPNGRPVKLSFCGEDVSFMPAEGTSPIAVSVDRKGNDVKFVLSSVTGNVLDEKNIKLVAAKLPPTAITFGVDGASSKTGLSVKTIVVNGPVKPTE